MGGYGRAELFPYSDVDLVILFENEQDLAAAKESLGEFLKALWDGGLHASHSVRSVAECCRFNDQNVELHVSLLDLRFVAGSMDLFRNVEQRLPEFYQRYAETIARQITESARTRHAKFNHTVYHMEPKCEGVSRRYSRSSRVALVGTVASANEAIREAVAELDGARRFLFALRCFLHFQSGRDYNLLTFELQEK